MQKVVRPFSQLNRVRSAHYIYNKNNNVVGENELRIEITQMKIKPQSQSTLEKMQIKRNFSLIDKLIARVNNMRVENEQIQKDITNYDLILRDLVYQCDQLYSNHKTLVVDQKDLQKQIRDLEPDRSEPSSFGVFRDFIKETSEKVEFVGKQVFDQQERIKGLFLKHENKQLHEKALQACIDIADQIKQLQENSLDNKRQISDLASLVHKDEQITQARILWAEVEMIQKQLDGILGIRQEAPAKSAKNYGLISFPVHI